MSETGLSFVSSKRQIFRTADKGCPLCRVLLDRFIADHDPYFGALSNLPFLGRITFCLRAVDGEIGSYSSENRSKFNVLQIAFLEDKVLQPESKRWLRKVRWWRKGQVLERFIHLEFFTIAAEADDPAAVDFVSRPMNLEVASTESIKKTQEWIQECVSNHKHCLPKPEKRPLPSRLVNVGIGESPTLTLCNTQGFEGEYIALSYCWGQKSQPVMNTKSTSSQFMNEGLPVQKLPQTIQDAICVTRKLGIQYLWVDVLCIIQDSREDKDKEIEKLQDYFSNAYITISAASASSCESGFLQKRESVRDKFPARMNPDRTPHAFKLPWRCQNGQLGRVRIQPWQEHDLLKEPVNARAWTLEERLLSPRMLSFTSNQNIWTCQSKINNSENNLSGYNPYAFSRLPNNIFTAGKGIFPSKPIDQAGRAEMFSYWRAVVEDYTGRALTNSEDKLRAISGIATRLKIAAPDLTYISGIWCSKLNENHALAAELMWAIPPKKKLIVGSPEELKCATYYPSFSWSSTSQPVTWKPLYKPGPWQWELSDTSLIEVVEFEFELSSPHLQFGPVNNAVIIIKAPTMDILAGRFGGDGLFIRGSTSFYGDLDTIFPIEISPEEFHYKGRVRHINHQNESEASVTLIRLRKEGGLILELMEDHDYRRIGVWDVQNISTDPQWLANFEIRTIRLK